MFSTEKLVKKIISQCMMGFQEYDGKLVSIEYSDDTDYNISKTIDLDFFIEDTITKIDDLEDEYHILKKRIDDGDMDAEDELDDNVCQKMYEIFPIFNFMHSDSSSNFINLICQHYDT